jgi:hypothetical protein
MIAEGDILLFRFPQSDLGDGKLRPALLIKRIHGDFDDCLVCMISTSLEATILLIAASIPLAAALRPPLLKLKSVRWVGGICITYGILISINFFVHMHESFTVSHAKIGLRLISWCALAFLTYWTLKGTTANNNRSCRAEARSSD